MQLETKQLLEFWLGSAEPKEMASHRAQWWAKDADFDQRIQNDFKNLFNQACAGQLDHWKDSPLGCTALIILLDQFPRNLFRNDGQAFATDVQARDLTRHALEKGYDQTLPMGAKLFLYLPLEHSENLDDQNQSVALMKAMGDEGYHDFALKHHVIIARFGRFPHRNMALGRENTPEEEAFLQQPDSAF